MQRRSHRTACTPFPLAPRPAAPLVVLLLLGVAGCPPSLVGPPAEDDDDSVAPGWGCDATLTAQDTCPGGEPNPAFDWDSTPYCPEFYEGIAPGVDGWEPVLFTFEELPLAELTPEQPFDYLELRLWTDWDATQIISSTGEKCGSATDPAACESEFDALSSDTGFANSVTVHPGPGCGWAIDPTPCRRQA